MVNSAQNQPSWPSP